MESTVTFYRRPGNKDCRGIPDGWMIGYYKIHICETSHLVCWARCVLYVPNNPDDCSHKSEFQIALVHPTVKTTWNVAFLAVIIKHFSFLMEIRIRIRAFVLRWILILPQASIILAGWTQTGSLDLCSGWIYSFVNLNYKCCTFFVPSSPFVDISKACHWHSNIFMSPGKPDKRLYLN